MVGLVMWRSNNLCVFRFILGGCGGRDFDTEMSQLSVNNPNRGAH